MKKSKEQKEVNNYRLWSHRLKITTVTFLCRIFLFLHVHKFNSKNGNMLYDEFY